MEFFQTAEGIPFRLGILPGTFNPVTVAHVALARAALSLVDEVQLAGERELAIRNLDRESNLLRNVKGALIRVADGSYGICMHCEEEIKPKRLDAVPWTKYCIRCQEAADRHEFEAEGSDTLDEMLANAA